MRKHGLSSQADGFDGFLLSMFAVHLVQQSRLVSYMLPACHLPKCHLW